MFKKQQLAITATEAQVVGPNHDGKAHRRSPFVEASSSFENGQQHLSTMPRILDKIELPDEPKRNTTSHHQPIKKKRRRIAGSHETTVSSYWTSSITLIMPFSYVSSQVFKRHE